MISWPQILTNESWQHEKGTVAKILGAKGGTGIGEAMTAAKAAFDKIDWHHWLPEGAAENDRHTLEERIKEVDHNWNKITEEAVKRLRNLRAAAADTHKAWANSKFVPAASARHVAEVAKAAEDMILKLVPKHEAYNAVMVEYSEVLRKAHKAEERFEHIKPAANKLKDAIFAVIKDPSDPNWNEMIKRMHFLAAIIDAIPQLKHKYSDEWKRLLSDEYLRNANEGDDPSAVRDKKAHKIGSALASFTVGFNAELRE